MQTKRILTDRELSYIKRNLKTTKNFIGFALVIIIIVVSILALAIYTEEDFNIMINILFGILILCIGGLYWYFKGYKDHKINPVVYKSKGVYKRIYESYSSKSGAYFDTINGIKVKLPWHWRKHLKKQGEITYEYIIRDGAVASSETSYLVISADKLSLDYELNNGLQKLKRISILQFISVILVFPIVLLLFTSYTVEDALKIREALKTPEEHTMILKDPEALLDLKTSEYVHIENAWVYQFPTMLPTLEDNMVITATERNRIYNHPKSNINLMLYLPTKQLKIPDKATFKKNIQNSPLSKNTLFQTSDVNILNRAIDKAYKSQLEDYNRKVNRNKKIEIILDELKPKHTIISVSTKVFDSEEKPPYSIRESLETPYSIAGFYDVNKNRIIPIDYHLTTKKRIIEAAITTGICLIILLISLYSLVKIIRNSITKQRLVKEQVNDRNLKRLT